MMVEEIETTKIMTLKDIKDGIKLFNPSAHQKRKFPRNK